MGVALPVRGLRATGPARLGYYALPVLWGDVVIGWANASVAGGQVQATLGYAGRIPKSLAFRRALDAELGRMAALPHARTPARRATTVGGTP